MKKTVITRIIILLSGNLFGQPGKSRGPGGQYSERMEMMIVWKLTDELELSEKQAEKFFPIMRSHQQLIKDIRRDEKDLFEPLYTKVKKGKKVSQQEVNNLLKNISSLDDKGLIQPGIGWDGLAITEEDTLKVNKYINNIKNTRKRMHMTTSFSQTKQVPEEMMIGSDGQEPDKFFKYEKARKGPSNNKY